MKIGLFIFLLGQVQAATSDTAQADSSQKSDQTPNQPPTVQRNASKARNTKQRADEAWRFTKNEDIIHSIQELMRDNYLQKLFPG